MDTKQNLVHQQRELSVPQQTSLTASQQTLGVELHLTALNSKSEPESALVQEFSRVFARVEPITLQWAFSEHRQRSQFFPAVSEIAGLICEYRIKERQRKEAEAAEQERLKIKTARESGELVEFTDIVKNLKDLAKFPDPPHVAKLQEARKKDERPNLIPAVPLTPEQIEARRHAELNEIKKAEQA